MIDNFLKRTDAYKYTHWMQYPKDAQRVFSYLEARGGEFDHTVFFGLQYFLKKIEGVVVEQWMIDEAEEFSKEVFGTTEYFNREGWEHIVNAHGGRLPVRINAVDEGSFVPVSNVLCTIENTDNKCPWIVGFLETVFMQIWYPCTVATISRFAYDIIDRLAEETGGSVSPFHLNDFGYRGVSSEQSAGIGGMAHLTSFAGTDNLIGIQFAKDHYAATGLIGASVMATEHSTTTAFGEGNEVEAYERFFDACPSAGILSIVSDSYDYKNCVTNIMGKKLKHRIMEREGVTVIRPDSGDPVEMAEWTLKELWEDFGGTENEKGYKVLHPKVAVIYGDGINLDTIEEMCAMMHREGFAVDGQNLIFGMGGGLLQQCNRDTSAYAFKCSAIQRSDGWQDVYKTASGKGSKRGTLKLTRRNGKYETVRSQAGGNNLLKNRFLNGNITSTTTFEEIRTKLKDEEAL